MPGVHQAVRADTADATPLTARVLGGESIPCYTQAPNLKKRGELWESPHLKVLSRTAKFACPPLFGCQRERRSMWSSRMLRSKQSRTLAAPDSCILNKPQILKRK